MTVGLSRRGALLGVLGLWAVGTAGLYALPSTPTGALLVVAEPQLRPWVTEVIGQSPALASGGWRIAAPDEIGDAASRSAIWLGVVGSAEMRRRRPSPVARSPYVVVAWEGALERLGLGDQRPVDWASIQRQVADPAGPRFAIPLPGTPLGDDGLLLLTLAHQGPDAAALALDDPPGEALAAWLRPFYGRQTRLRADERILVDDWARYRTNVGDAGLLPEAEALALLPVVAPQAKLHVRYPNVNLTRTYALAPPSERGATAAYERLRSALVAPEAQRALAEHGFRPVAEVPPPTTGPFVAHRARGVDWGARWTEASRTEAFDTWAVKWRP